MKLYTFLIATGIALAFYSCTVGAPSAEKQNAAYLDSLVSEYFSDDYQYNPDDRDSIISIMQDMNIQREPHNDIIEIVNELRAIEDTASACCYRHKLYGYAWQCLFHHRALRHLSNPITFTDSVLLSNVKSLTVCTSPDGKYKFYLIDCNICHLGLSWNSVPTYYQYLDSSRTVVCREWQGDRDFDFQTSPHKIWQFDHNDTTFYVMKSYYFVSSSIYGLRMEICSFHNGIPQYHIRFFPEEFGIKEFGPVKKIIKYRDNDVDEEWVYASAIIATTGYMLGIDYTFDSKTLSIDVLTQSETDCNTLENKRYKLRLE